MKKIIISSMIVVFCLGCWLNKTLGKYKLKDGTDIVLNYYAGGATVADIVYVKKKNSDSILYELKGFNDKYLYDFSQLNDTLLKITITDTAYFKGVKTERLVNLNKQYKK